MLEDDHLAGDDEVDAAEAEVEPEVEPTNGDDAAADELRESLAQMREEADRIADLGTGDEQVEAAERFAEQAGKLDEQVGAAARATDAEDS